MRAESFSCKRWALSVRSFAEPPRLRRKAVKFNRPFTGKKSGAANGVLRARDRDGEGSTAADSSNNLDMEQELMQQTKLLEAKEKRQDDLRREELKAREAELFGEPDGTAGNFEEQPEWLKKLITWGEWLIVNTEGNEKLQKGFDKALIIFFVFWAIAVGITGGFIKVPFYNFDESIGT
ncbi:hypothetical protein KFL_003400050 [Klebsormidium nitens]|uniref:Uncharacterized protein n=1 Tax=Klebsormidium nitens TaxID=105231 RepID=A0A1Y1IB96_KLENI|nr:hypothetical protein KFL_003400050 [Klebsormidium nitens]|eukprot:GAQ87232.1 hypothetical protein KFL_003400050 [Klebsormidium nitens]